MFTGRKEWNFSLTKKMVAGTVLVSCITYGTSAFFLFVLKNVFSFMPYWLYTLLVLACGVIWTGILGYFAALFIAKVIKNLQHGVTQASDGDLTVEIKVANTHDELMVLSQLFQKMILNLRQTVLDIHTFSTKTQEKVTFLTNRVSDATYQSKVIGETIEEIAKGAERQSQSALTTFDSIQESMKLADQIDHHVVHSSQLSKEMVTILEESETVVRSLINGILRLSEKNQTQSKKIDELSRDAQEIGGVTKMMTSFVEETNLLALNATIEAARAGEAGRGFSVVASEIQKLATNSGQSLKRIDDIIKGMQEKVEQVVKDIQTQHALVDEESDRANQTDLALSNVKKAVLGVADSVDKIKEDSVVQKQKITQIMEEAQDVAAVAQETSAASEEVASTAQEQGAIMSDLAAFIQELSGETIGLVDHVKSLKVS